MVTFIGGSDPIPAAARISFSSDTAPPPDFNEQVERLVPQRIGVVESIAKFIPTVLTQFVDTTSASLGLSEKGDINDAVLSGIPGLHNFSKQNQGSLDVGVGVAELVLTTFVAGRVFKTGTTINTALRGIRGGRAIALLDQNRKLALARVATLDRAIASQSGLQGGVAFLADAVLFGVKTPTRNIVANAARRASIKKNVVEGAIVEAQLGLIANQNEFLFTDETSTNIALAAMGIVIPGIVGNLAANFEMRRFANSDAIKRLAFNAVDRGGFGALIESPIGYVDRETGKLIIGGKDLSGITTNGANTDLATGHLLARNAKQAERPGKAGDGISFDLAANRNRSANSDEEIAFKLIERVFQRPVPGIKEGSGKLTGEANQRAIQHVKAITRVDETAFLGVEHAIFLKEGDNLDNIMANFNSRLDDIETQALKLLDDPNITQLQQDNIQATLKTVAFNRTLEPMVARNMEFVPMAEAKAAGKGFRGEIEVSSTQGLTAWEVAGTRSGKAISVTDDGKMILPRGIKDPSQMKLEDTQGLFRAGDRALTAMSQRGSVRIVLDRKANWFELDFAEELLRRTNGTADVMYPKGITRESAKIESLAQKADIIHAKLGVDSLDRIGLSPNNLILREQLNLPRLKSFERGATGTDKTGIDNLILGAKDGDEIRRFTEIQIKKTLGEFREATDLIKFSADEIDLLGTSFKLGVDQSSGAGKEIADFLVLKRPIGDTYFTRDFLTVRLANRQADIFASLIDDNAGDIVRAITRELISLDAFQAAIKSSDLSELQLQGSLPFRGNTSTQTSLQFGDFAFRDSPVLLSAQIVQDSAKRASTAAFDRVITAPIKQLGGRSASDLFAALRNPKNKDASQLLNQFISARRGWVLSGKTVDTGDGFFKFLLSNNNQNRTQWARLFPGESMPKNAALPFARKTEQNVVQEVHLDQLSFDALEAFQEIAGVIRTENNTVLRANGFGELGQVAFHVPPRDFSNQFVEFILDGNGKVVQIVAENTEAQLSKSLRILEADADSLLNLPGFTRKSQDTIEQFQSIWERAHNGLQDANVPIIQSGTSNRGASLSPFVEFNAWESSIRQYQGQFNRLGKDIVETMFKNQLRGAKTRASVARINKKNIFTGKEVQERNIHDIYSNVLLGRSPLNDKGSPVGQAFNLIESLIDDKLVKFDRTFQQINPFTGSARAARQYTELVKSIEDKMPFRSTQEFLEQRLGSKTPPTIRKLTGQMNRLTAGLVLRWAEFAHPILNITGMVNTAPAVIRQFTQRPGEAFSAYERRVGPWAHIYRLKDGSAVSSLDIGKIMHRAFGRTFKGKAAYTEEEWRFVKGRGYLDQEVAEFHNQLQSITKSEAGFSKFYEKTDKWIGVLSDKSEQFARSYFHNAGLDVADLLGIKGVANRHAFAHDLANRGIANYNPLNRPEIFQGGIGAPIGLFQSYMWNFLQRNYRYLETGDFRTLGIQTAMQGTMFGLVTIPGFKQYNDLMNSVSDGETNPYDGVYQRFDRETADFITAGVPSSLPRVFGAPDGVALFTRGDTAPRLPIINSSPPIVQIGRRFGRAMGQGIDMFLEGGQGFSAQQLTEILGNAIPNRPFSGLMDIFAGSDTDERGQVVSRQVNTMMGAVSRVLGFKTLSEAKAAEAFHANKVQNQMQLAKRDRLNRSTRSAIRGGEFDKLPGIVVDYLNTGGDPADLKQWLRGAFLAANTTRNERQLMRVLNDVDKMNQVKRLLDAMRPIE